MWDEQDKNEFEKLTSRKVGQICNDSFSFYISKLASNLNNKTFLEIGTWNGLGSTLAFSQGFKSRNDDYIFYSLECNKEKCEQAKLLYKSNKKMNILNEVIWNQEPDNFYDIFPQCKLNKTYERWNTVDIINMKKCNLFLDRENLPEIFDVLLLDGGEFTTYFEYKKLKDRCKYLLLDDINTDKCKLIVRELLNEPTKWEILYSESVRNGFLIAINRKYKNEINFDNLNIDEAKNHYVSSRGIMKSCDIFSKTPISSIKKCIMHNYINIKKCEKLPKIYVCSSAIPNFIDTVLPLINYKFILVSGDCDEDIPDNILSDVDFHKFINNENIIHWFCQNWIGEHEKVTLIPIGLDYHTLANSKYFWGPKTSCEKQEKQLLKIVNKAKKNPFWKRNIKCYSNFHFALNTKHSYDRRDAINNISKNLIIYEKLKTTRLNTWMNQIKYTFVISPHGGGYDCHRTWEALVLGCIVIVKTSKLDSLFEDLPVLIVNEWSDVTKELLEETVEKFKNMTFNMEKLTLKYWTNKFDSF